MIIGRVLHVQEVYCTIVEPSTYYYIFRDKCNIVFNCACFCAGRAIHKPRERGIRVHAGPGTRRRAGGHGTGTAGCGTHLSVPGVFVHGQRDIVPAETVPGRGQPGRVLGPMSGHRARHVSEDVAH